MQTSWFGRRHNLQAILARRLTRSTIISNNSNNNSISTRNKLNHISLASFHTPNTNTTIHTNPSYSSPMVLQWKSNARSLLATAALSSLAYNTMQLTCHAFDISSPTVIRRGAYPSPFAGLTTPHPLTTTTRLYSTTPSNTSSSTTATEKVVARGTPISFVPSSNGRSGVLAVKLREEDIVVDEDATVDVEAAVEMAKKHKAGAQGEDFIGKSVQFENGKTGIVVAQRPPMAFVLCDFPTLDIPTSTNEIDTSIAILSSRTTVSVGDHLIGTVIDYHGTPISTTTTTPSPSLQTNDEASNNIDRAIFSPIPRVADIGLIDTPFLTGTAMVDALAPIGKGQNMLVIGQDSGVGQREFAIAMIRAQIEEFNARKQNTDVEGEDTKMVKCVYALTSNEADVREEVLQQLTDAGIMEYVVVVTTKPDDTNHAIDSNGAINAADAGEAVTIAGTACSIGEAFALARGEDTLVIVDDIDQHKELWDWSTRVLVDVYGMDAVVKEEMEGGASSEMRAFYSGLIQRAAKFKANRGGGSMTLALLTNLPGKFGDDDDEDSTVFTLEDFSKSSDKIQERIQILTKNSIPLTTTNLRKIQIPIPNSSTSERLRRIALVHVDDLISMSDGQIWFDEKLHSSGQRPAIDAQRSITRVGIGADTKSRADAPAMRNLVGGLRFEFAQAGASLEGAGEGSGGDKMVLKRDAYLLAMHQEMGVNGEVRSLSENCVLLLAVSIGCLNRVIGEGMKAGTKGGSAVVKGLLEKVWEVEEDGMKEIDATLDITPEVRSRLEAVIKDHLA